MLLCDFHVHTTYSDGALPLPRVVDLFGQSGHGGHRIPAKDVPLLPVRDLLCAALFWSGLVGRRTSWRGRSVVVGPRSLIVTEPVAGGDALRPVAVR
jgi:hypothetical protein